MNYEELLRRIQALETALKYTSRHTGQHIDSGVDKAHEAAPLTALTDESNRARKAEGELRTATATALETAQKSSQPGHLHGKSDVTDFPTSLEDFNNDGENPFARVSQISGGEGGIATVITDGETIGGDGTTAQPLGVVPDRFAGKTHNHVVSEITDFTDNLPTSLLELQNPADNPFARDNDVAGALDAHNHSPDAHMDIREQSGGRDFTMSPIQQNEIQPGAVADIIIGMRGVLEQGGVRGSIPINGKNITTWLQALRNLTTGLDNTLENLEYNFNDLSDNARQMIDDINNMIGLPEWDMSTFVLSFETHDGRTRDVDLSALAADLDLDLDFETQELFFTKADGSEVRIPLTGLIPVLEGFEGAQIQTTVDDGVIKAQVIKGTINADDFTLFLREYIDSRAAQTDLAELRQLTDDLIADLNGLEQEINELRPEIDGKVGNAHLTDGDAHAVLFDNKLSRTEQAYDSARLGGQLPDYYTVGDNFLLIDSVKYAYRFEINELGGLRFVWDET